MPHAYVHKVIRTVSLTDEDAAGIARRAFASKGLAEIMFRRKQVTITLLVWERTLEETAALLDVIVPESLRPRAPTDAEPS